MVLGTRFREPITDHADRCVRRLVGEEKRPLAVARGLADWEVEARRASSAEGPGEVVGRSGQT